MTRETWLSPLGAAWQSVYPTAEVPWGQLAKYAHGFTQAMPVEKVCADLRGYLARTPQEYVSLAHWAQTFGSWTAIPRVLPEPVQFREVLAGQRMRLEPEEPRPAA